MSKDEYIEEIIKLLERCNKESTLYFIKGFLLRNMEEDRSGGFSNE